MVLFKTHRWLLLYLVMVRTTVSHPCTSLESFGAYISKSSKISKDNSSILSFLSLNTRELKENVKCKAIFLFGKEQKA